MMFGHSFTVSGKCFIYISVVASFAATGSALSLDKRDLPWEELKNKLSLEAQRSFLQNTGPEHYVQQCIPVFLKENPTQLELYAQTDGLCMNTVCILIGNSDIAHGNEQKAIFLIIAFLLTYSSTLVAFKIAIHSIMFLILHPST